MECLDTKWTFGTHLQEGDFDKRKCIKMLVPRMSKTLNPNSQEQLLNNLSQQARETSSQWGPQSHVTANSSQHVSQTMGHSMWREGRPTSQGVVTPQRQMLHQETVYQLESSAAGAVCRGGMLALTEELSRSWV